MDAPAIDPSAADDPGPADAGAAPTGPPRRRLARRSDDRLIAGVAGGVADHLGIDVVLVRLAFVVTALLGGFGVIAYLLGWLLLPSAPPRAPGGPQDGDRKQLLGYGLIGLGLVAIGGQFGWDFERGGAFWALVLIGLGAAVLWLRSRDALDEPGPPVDAPAPPPPPARPPDPPSSPPPAPPAPTTASSVTTPLGTTAAPTTPGASIDAPAATPAPAKRRRRARSPLVAITWSALLVLAGAAWLLDAWDLVQVDVGVLLALALALVGVALAVSAWYGRARGLIALGIPLVLVVGVFGLIDVPLRGGIGDTTHRPRTVAALEREYSMAVGNLSVDLSDVDFSGTRKRVHAQLGIGDLDITVPDDVRVVVDGHAGAGRIDALGRSSDDCCPSELRVVRAGVAGAGTVVIDADVGAGHIQIVRREESPRGTS